MEVEPRTAGYGCRIGTLGPVLVTVFDSKPELQVLDLLETEQTAHVGRVGKVISVTIITMDKLDPPGADFRARAAKLAEKNREALVAGAIVILSKGVVAVVVRTFLAAYQLVVPFQRTSQTFRDLPAAVAWLQGLPNMLPEVKAMTGLLPALEAFAAKK